MRNPVIVVGFDASLGARAALLAAIDLGIAMHLPIVAVHVEHMSATVATATLTGPGSGEAFAAEADFTEHCRVLCTEALEPTDLRWTFEIRDGNPADELLKAAEDHNAAFIVVGRQGHHTLGGLLASSVSQRLLHHARRRLLVIPAT